MKLSGAVQRFYLTAKAFFSNDLPSYACAGAFNFLLSSVPLALVTISICLRIWQNSGAEILTFLNEYEMLSDSFDWEKLIEYSPLLAKPSGLLETFAVVSLLWISRRFFLSIQSAVKRIYSKKKQRKAIKQNLFIIASEIVLVLSIILIIFAITAFKAFLGMDLSGRLIPPVALEVLHTIFRFAPSALLCAFLFLVYKITPLPHPKAHLSFACAAMCSAGFTVFSFFFSLIIDTERYNLIYGLLGNMILLLIEVYLFFIFFLFFAQFQYVSQFYDNFVFAQIYLISKDAGRKPRTDPEARLFRRPARLTRYEVAVPAGGTVFRRGEKSYDVYYICAGTIKTDNGKTAKTLGPGETFGDFAFLTGTYRIYTATAETGCILLKIPPALFQETINVASAVARRTLQIIAEHIDDILRNARTGDAESAASGGQTPHAEIEIENDL